MDETTALGIVDEVVEVAGDDAAIVDGLVFTTDMLHDRTDFPAGTTRYTAGWRAVGASLSDVAAMGATARAAVAVYAAPTFVETELRSFLAGAGDVCDRVGARYVGGDLDIHDEFTVATAAIGEVDAPVSRSGAVPGERVYVTGALGRSAAAVRLFASGDIERANELFRFVPRIRSGNRLGRVATAMMDVSDGIARSLHQLAAASECGFSIDREAIPIDPAARASASDPGDLDDLALFFGEDFELILTAPEGAVEELASTLPVSVTAIGRVVDEGVTMDGNQLPDRGYAHGTGE